MNGSDHWKHLLIDASGLLTQLHYEVDALNGEGRPIGGIIGMLELVKCLQFEFKPKSLTLVWSLGESKGRKSILKEYGSRRKQSKDPAEVEAIEWQKKVCREIISFTPARQVAVAGVEARDAITYISKTLQRQKLIVTTDKDYFQLLSEHVQVFDPKKDLLISKEEANIILGFDPKYFLLWRTLVGDSSRGIKGIPGIGKVKAKRLIQSVKRTNRKFPLKPAEKEILDRNKLLMSLGTLLAPHEKQAILEQYQEERTKKAKSLSTRKLKEIGVGDAFKDLFTVFRKSEGYTTGSSIIQ